MLLFHNPDMVLGVCTLLLNDIELKSCCLTSYLQKGDGGDVGIEVIIVHKIGLNICD